MSESLGQGYGLEYHHILHSLRPLVEIYSFCFSRESPASEKTTCKDM